MKNAGENIFIKSLDKYFLVTVFVFQLVAGVSQSNPGFNFQNTNLREFYSALKSQDTIRIVSFLKIYGDNRSSTSIAYTGALLMKKSELKKTKQEKLTLFRQGRKLLEGVIAKENNNAEFRFLRLIIQENCPAFLKYRDNIKDDADKVKQFYKIFSPQLKREVADYSKVSKTLKPGDFEN